MRISEQTRELIKNFEGFRREAYCCPAGYKTIGYGHVLDSNSKLNNISEIQAEELLNEDIQKAEAAVARNIKIDLKQGQFDALVSFTFNLGGGALQRSSLRQKVNRQDHDDVPQEFKRWIYAGGVLLHGLVMRREVEAKMYAGRFC
jgi:lysozyme